MIIFEEYFYFNVKSLALTLIGLSVDALYNSGSPAEPGKPHHSSIFSLFMDYVSCWGLLEFQSLKNVFVTVSRMIDLNYFVSQVFSNICW